MKSMAQCFSYVITAACTIALIGGCSDTVRGRENPSSDGKTYLAVETLNGSACKSVFVDGRLWPHALHVAGEIKPGEHEIKCATSIRFAIRAGTVFYFNNWAK